MVRMNDTLYLPLKAKYYDMIESGEKPEEYRENKPYWRKRLCHTLIVQAPHIIYNEYLKQYKYACFSYGYTKRRMVWEVESIRFGYGNPAWGAPKDEKVFIIKLGKRIK